MSYIGSTPTSQNFTSGTDYFNGTGSQTAFTLSRIVNSVNDIEVVINNVTQQPNTAYTISGTTITFTSAPSAGSGNIYVRYLSTTTQTIAPSPATVQYSSLNSDNQSKLGIQYKNRIINGAMVIDQRNAGAAINPINNNTFIVDRWSYAASQSSKFSAQQNAGSVTSPVGFTNYLGFTSLSAYSVTSTDYFFTIQRIEGYNIADLAWGTVNAKTITLSFQVYSSLTGTFGALLSNNGDARTFPFTYTVSSANTWTQVSVTIPGDTTGTWLTTNGAGINVMFSLGAGSTRQGTPGAWVGSAYYGVTGQVNVVATSGATFYITGVQLEVGTQATQFTTAGGSYGAELALCQRYAYVVNALSGNAGDRVGIGYAQNTTQVLFFTYFPVTMRTAPSISGTASQMSFNDGTAAYPSSAISLQSSTINLADVQLTISGLTAYRPGQV